MKAPNPREKIHERGVPDSVGKKKMGGKKFGCQVAGKKLKEGK